MISDEQRREAIQQLQGAMALEVAFVGVANSLFSVLARLGAASPATLAREAGADEGYVTRWCDAAFAFGYLEERGDELALSDLGGAFRPEAPGTLVPFAVQSILGAHMAERAAAFTRTGERPGEVVLAERETVLRWFGPMLEGQFSPLFEREILPAIPAFGAAGERGGLVVDLGCGNGWYLRALAARWPRLRGLGLDGFSENIRQAEERARQSGLADRLSFREGDIHAFALDEPASLISLNRALHHVWNEKARLFALLARSLAPGGAAVIWEPAWPSQRTGLREIGRRAMAFQNLSEHVQGNHFLRPEEIEAALRSVGLTPRVHLFAGGNEAVVVGTRE